MSIRLKIDDIPYEEREGLIKDLRIYKKTSKYDRQAKFIEPYLITEDDYIYLPFQYALKNISNSSRPERKELDIRKTEFTGKLRELQKTVRDQAVSILNKTGSVILSLYCGFGKTFLAIHLSSRIGLKTLILCHRIVLIEQWEDSIKKVCPNAKYQILNTKTDVDRFADFYIVNAANVEKIGFFDRVGTVIVDECHVIATDTLSKSLFYTTPRYLIGLSATPHRSDGMDILLDLYFGTEKINKQLFRKHLVYKVNTGIKIEAKINVSGQMDWSSVIEAQSNSEERNGIILDIISKFPDRYFLVLCKRVSQASYLIEKLEEKKESVTSLIGNNNKYDEKARVMIATVQKCGVGFSHEVLNTLVIAADMEEYFIQYLGRVMRTEEGEPIVFDLVDDHPVLKKHFSTRKGVYLESGGEIKNWKM
jgi:superfamily II DNA or RNA helicase